MMSVVIRYHTHCYSLYSSRITRIRYVTIRIVWMTVRQAMMYNFLSACTCYLGLVIGQSVSHSQSLLIMDLMLHRDPAGRT